MSLLAVVLASAIAQAGPTAPHPPVPYARLAAIDARMNGRPHTAHRLRRRRRTAHAAADPPKLRPPIGLQPPD